MKHPLGKDAIPDPVIISKSTTPISPATPLHSFSLARRSFPMSEQFPPNFVSLNSAMPKNRIMQYFMTLSMKKMYQCKSDSAHLLMRMCYLHHPSEYIDKDHDLQDNL